MIGHLDHLVLTTRDKAACIDFYTRVLGMRLETFGVGRHAFKFGAQKINLHEAGKEFLPKADLPTPGSLDLCFIAAVPLDVFIAHLAGRWGLPSRKVRWPARAPTGPSAPCICATRTAT